MGRTKLIRFASNAENQQILEPGKPLFENIKGQWNDAFFAKPQPITLELACGRGEYTVGLAQVYDERNFIGIDRKGERIWQGCKIAQDNSLSNVGFIRCHISHLENHFAPQEVSEIWIVHPDPRPKAHDERRRLTNPRYLNIYKNILQPDGWIRLKTDNSGLFEYTLEVLKEQPIKDLSFTWDLYESPELLAEHHGIVTRYEQKFTAEGHKIKYLKFRFLQTK
jgi:tRNA (guanine-N7-)-methyltransferase